LKISGEFKYRKLWTRTFISIIYILILFPIKETLVLDRIIRDDLSYIFSVFITILLIFVYYKITRGYFIREGRYTLNNNCIEIYMNNKLKIANIDNIKEISYMKRSIFGENFILLTIIQYDQKTIKIISDDIISDYDIKMSPLYKIYEFIEGSSENLQEADYNDSKCFVLESKNV